MVAPRYGKRLGIEKGPPLTDDELGFIVELVMGWFTDHSPHHSSYSWIILRLFSWIHLGYHFACGEQEKRATDRNLKPFDMFGGPVHPLSEPNPKQLTIVHNSIIFRGNTYQKERPSSLAKSDGCKNFISRWRVADEKAHHMETPQKPRFSYPPKHH